MRLSLASAALFATCVLSATASSSDVLVATKANFPQLLKDNHYILAEFHAPWCGHCKNLAPEFEKAATMLKDAEPPVALVQIDATVEKSLADTHNVKGFPTLKWFHDGEAMEYTGGRDHAAIVSWCKKRSGEPSSELTDQAAVDEFKTQAPAVLLGLLSRDSPEFSEFSKVGSTLDQIPVGHTVLPELLSTYAPAKVVMLQKFDEGVQRYDGPMNAADIKGWALANSLPLVMEFNRENQPRIFSESAPSMHLLALHSTQFAGKDQVVESLKNAAQQHRGSLLCVTVEDSADNSGVFNFFGVKAEEVKGAARLVGIDQSGSGMRKYFYTGVIDVAGVQSWVDDWLAGKLSPTLKSATAPAEMDNKGPVRIVVGSTFKREVIQSGKDSVVQFYAPWCGHCKQFAHQYDKLAAAFDKVDSVQVVKIDATENEVEEVDVKGFPTFYLFKAKDPSNPILYEGPRTLDDMEKFVRESFNVAVSDGSHNDGEL